MVGGRSGRVASTAVRTSSVAFCMSVPSSNSMKVTEEPRVAVLWTCLTYWMPAMAFSIGRLIWFSTSAGAAPLWVIDTATAGKAMLGYCLIRSEG